MIAFASSNLTVCTKWGQALIQLELYSTLGCHLCERAETVLQRVSRQRDVSWHVVEIAQSNKLVDTYGLRIPVVRSKSGMELGWPFDEDQLIGWLDQIFATTR